MRHHIEREEVHLFTHSFTEDVTGAVRGTLFAAGTAIDGCRKLSNCTEVENNSV